MRTRRLWLTGFLGAALLGGLMTMISLDLVHRSPATPITMWPGRAAPPTPEGPAPAPDCCAATEPIRSTPPPLPHREINPSLPFLLHGEVPMDLQATDRSLTIRLTSDQVRRLRDTLALARPAEIPSPSAMIQRYPNLYVVAHLPNGAVTLVLNNEAYLAESHPGRPSYDTWTMPPGLWAEVAGWLPPETSKPGELAYLLRAERLIEQYPTGPISYEANRAALIARLLQAGIPIAQSAGEPQFTHTYVVESQAYPVEVGGDWFTYAGQRYHLPEAALYLNANLHAN